MNETTTTEEFQTMLLWNIGMNILSLSFFLAGRKHTLFLKSYDFIQYFWALQVLVLLLPEDLLDVRAKIVISYGFGFDYKNLEITVSNAGSFDIIFRFITNLVHHLTLLDTTTHAQRYMYCICWLSHTFPWFKLFGKMHWFKRLALIGNFAPVCAFLWLVSTGQSFPTTGVLSPASKGILLMMVVYRGFYINCSFHVFSGLGILSKKEEATNKQTARQLTVLVSLLVIAQLYCPSLLCIGSTTSALSLAVKTLLLEPRSSPVLLI